MSLFERLLIPLRLEYSLHLEHYQTFQCFNFRLSVGKWRFLLEILAEGGADKDKLAALTAELERLPKKCDRPRVRGVPCRLPKEREILQPSSNNPKLLNAQKELIATA